MASGLLLVQVVVSLALSLSLKHVVLGSSSMPKIYTVEVLNEYPHDPEAFTQGLLYWENDTVYESTGIYGRSSVRRVALQTGEVEALHKMDDDYFGEGLTLLDERFQLKSYYYLWKLRDRFNLFCNYA